MSRRPPDRPARERYDLAASPWAQDMTQRDVADLLRFKKSHLENLVRFKDAWIVRREALIGRKTRNLVYPFGRLRRVHERLKYQFGKLRQPDYLYSPRAGRAQRDNALLHLDQQQYLTLDLCQFYPSTTSEHVFRWARYGCGLRDDVAALLTKLSTVDERLSFGSPLSPVLATLVHRAMFDWIADACVVRGLRVSLWVDDLTISGRFVPGELLHEIRATIAGAGLRSHKVAYLTGRRPVTISGLPVTREGLQAPRSLHQRVQDCYELLRQAESDLERTRLTDLLLGQLGTLRYYVGSNTLAGRRAADQMHALRRRRHDLTLMITTPMAIPLPEGSVADTTVPPWE